MSPQSPPLELSDKVAAPREVQWFAQGELDRLSRD